MQDKSQAGKELEVRADIVADERKEAPHWLAIQGAEIDRLIKEEQHGHGPRHGENDRIADVRHGDAVAVSCGRQSFPGQKDLQEIIPVAGGRQRDVLNHRGQNGLFVLAFQPITDSAAPQRLRQGQRRGGRPMRKKVGRDRDIARGNPFQELGAVEPVLIVNFVSGELLRFDPVEDFPLGTLSILAISRTDSCIGTPTFVGNSGGWIYRWEPTDCFKAFKRCLTSGDVNPARRGRSVNPALVSSHGRDLARIPNRCSASLVVTTIFSLFINVLRYRLPRWARIFAFPQFFPEDIGDRTQDFINVLSRMA